VPVERERLDGAPRLARDHEQRPREVRRVRHGKHGGRVGAVEHGQAGPAEARREHLWCGARAAHAAYHRVRQPIASRAVGEAHEIIPLRQGCAGRVFPSEEVHTAAKHNEPSRPPGMAVRLARRSRVPPLTRLTRTLAAIAAVSFLAILLAYLLAPADRAGRTLVAAVLLGVAVAVIGVWFIYSQRANRRYAALLENEVASQTRSLMDSLAATAAAERNLRLVMEAVPDAIVVVDREGRILESNGPTQVMGALVTPAVNRSIFEFLAADAAAVVRGKLAAAFHGEIQRFETPFSRDDGTHGVATLLYAPIREGSRITRVLILARDVTEQKRNESQFQQAEKLAAMG